MHKGVIWHLCGSSLLASSRLQGYLINEELQKRGIPSYVAFGNNISFAHDIGELRFDDGAAQLRALSEFCFVFQKLYGENTCALVEQLKRSGVFTVGVQCDPIEAVGCFPAFDVVLVPTIGMEECVRQWYNGRVCLIEDPYEYETQHLETGWDVGKPRDVLWFGYAQNWPALREWSEVIRREYESELRLITCSNHPEATVKWSPHAMVELLTSCSFSILPYIEDGQFNYKSSNRLVQSLAAGLPVIAGPLSSYIELSKKTRAVRIVRNIAELREALFMYSNARILEELSCEAKAFARNKYNVSTITDAWIRVLGLEKPETRYNMQLAVDAYKNCIRPPLGRVLRHKLSRALTNMGLRNR